MKKAIQLQLDEEMMLSSNNERVILTNVRIIGNYSEWGFSNKIYIFLEDISSVQIIYKSNIVFIILAIICGIYSLVGYIKLENFDNQFLYGILIGIIFLLIWLFTRRRTISISPDGGKALDFETGAMKEEQVNNFLEKLQLAKAQRIKKMYKLD